MKKINIFILTLLLSLISGTSFGQLSATDSVIVTGTNSYGDRGRGFQFTPNTNLFITELGKRVASAAGNYTWVIWDVATQTVVHQQTSNSNTATVYTYETISSPVQLMSGVSYILMLYCDSSAGAQYYFGASSQVNSNLTYGSMRYCNTCIPSTFPTNTLASFHYGTPDFHFTLTPCGATSSNYSVSECGTYTVPSGNETYTTVGTQTVLDTIPNSCGGDSVMTINLTINPVPNATTSLSGVTITSNQTSATYQWIDCNNGDSIIIGATNASYTPTVNGNYAVVVSIGSCSDTSSCVTISTVGINENEFGSEVNIHPNPTNGDVVLDLGDETKVTITITNIAGKTVYSLSSKNKDQINLSLNDFSKGVYFVKIQNDNRQKIIKLIKK